MPLLALARLMHFRIPRFLPVLRGRGGADQRGVYNRATLELRSARLQHPPHLGEDSLAQLVLFQQVPELEQRRRVWRGFTAQVNAHKTAQAETVVQRLFAREVGEVEPVLHKMNSQHPLQRDRRSAVAAFRVLRLDNRGQFSPRHKPVHLIEKRLASRRFALRSESSALIDCHH
jgi:uncharacterized protein (DUF924 family)